jgi:hypothetical protein
MLGSLVLKYPHTYSSPAEVPFPRFSRYAADSLRGIPPGLVVTATVETAREILESPNTVFADCGLAMGLLMAERNPDAIDHPVPLSHPRHVATPEDVRNVHYMRPADDDAWALAQSFSSFHGHWVFECDGAWIGGSVDGPIESRPTMAAWAELLSLRIWFDAEALPDDRRTPDIANLVSAIRGRNLQWITI